ncbi:MAG: ABC transporter ATP-binding protein [Planctomycetota bacterium]
MSELHEHALEVDGLKVRFHTDDGVVEAVRGVSYTLARGETLAVVGESGSGKSVLHMAMMDLLPPSAEVRARGLRIAGRNVLGMSGEDRRRLRGKEIAMIFQDPMTSLNPFTTLGTQIAEMLRLHRGLRGRRLREAVVGALDEVQIPNAAYRVEQYPHEFSGGMRQRAMIAMMLAGQPEVLVADEPTTALDVTVQAWIMELLASLQQQRGMSIVLITHDLGLVAGSAHRVAVMYAGRIVEEATTDALFADPRHPYTRGLLASVPRLDHDGGELYQIPGRPPDLGNLDRGCPFRPRCPYAVDRCAAEDPDLTERAAGHRAACWVELEPWKPTAAGAAR